MKLNLKEIDSNYKLLKQSNPELLLSKFLQAMAGIVELNENLELYTNEKPIKPPLEKVTVLTNHLKKFELTIEVFSRYYSDKHFTKNQHEKLVKRIEHAKKNMKNAN